MRREPGEWMSRVSSAYLSGIVALVALGAGLSIPVPAAEDAEVVVSPGQIVKAALAHSHRLRILDHEIAAAQARRSQARAESLPRLSADAQASSYTGPDDSELGPGITIPFIENRYSGGLTLSQPVYTGGRLTGLKKSAANSAEAARHDRRSAEADLVLEALTAYWNWSKAHDSVAAFEAGVARMEAHARDMENRRRAGLATENEALSTEVQLERTRLRLDEARRRVEVAKARIAFLTGEPVGERSRPVLPAAGAELPAVRSDDELIEAAFRNRSEPLARQAEWRAALAGVDVNRAGYRPQISLVGRYEEARPNMLSIPPEDRWQEVAFAGVSLSWNFFDFGLTRAKVAEASARARQAEARLAQTAEEIVLQVREARINLQTAAERVAVAERAEQSARRNVESAESLWRTGLARHADFLDAEADWIDAQSELAAARADLQLARASLEYATGRLSAESVQHPMLGFPATGQSQRTLDKR